MLTDTAVRALKPRAKEYKKSDAGGLYLLVKPTGAKLWRLAYRYSDKQRTLIGGKYPFVGLAAARDWRDQAKSEIASGQDPREAERARAVARKAAEADTFEKVARDWLRAMRPQWSPKYAALVQKRFESDLFPQIGKLPVSKVSSPELRAALKAVEDRGAIEFARRLRAHCGCIFRFAIAEGKAAADPSASIADAQPKPKPKRHRARVAPADMPRFFGLLAKDEGAELTHLALRWTMLTMVRTQETRFATKTELEGLDDLAPLWRIPPERMKMQNEHVVPLAPQAVALLKRIFELSGDSKHLFPVPGTKKGVISENRMLDCMYRMGYRGKATVHGFRGLASTVLNEATRIDDRGEVVRLWDSDWVERQLAHVEERETRRAYNAAEWIGPRRRMMSWWADWLDAHEAQGLSVPT